MKNLLVFIILLSLLLVAGIANAEPDTVFTLEPIATPSPSPLQTPVSDELIHYGVSGEKVVRIQLRLRELGYFNFKPTGLFQSTSADAAKRFQTFQRDEQGNPIIADGTIGAQSLGILFSREAVRNTITAGIPIGSSLIGTPTITGTLISWNDIKTTLKIGNSYTVVDYNTGTQFSLTYTGGENHAEAEAATPQDSATIKSVFGDAFSYYKRPVVILVGEKKIAASLQGFPHGSDQVSQNDMDGHICLYFQDSLSHVGALPDAEHTNLVYKAAGR
ncbi:MAG: peptidoglycan-binding protein [Clostridia bacterium]|nr:peptidoglycan-binding protein [Clostridia bacterium]